MTWKTHCFPRPHVQGRRRISVRLFLMGIQLIVKDDWNKSETMLEAPAKWITHSIKHTSDFRYFGSFARSIPVCDFIWLDNRHIHTFVKLRVACLVWKVTTFIGIILLLLFFFFLSLNNCVCLFCVFVGGVFFFFFFEYLWNGISCIKIIVTHLFGFVSSIDSITNHKGKQKIEINFESNRTKKRDSEKKKKPKRVYRACDKSWTAVAL